MAEIMGSTWLGPDWLAWRAFIKVLFSEYLDEDEKRVFITCTGLDEPPKGIQREAWLPVGRRGGKSRIEAMIAVHLACCYDWTPYLAPGELGYITVLADQRDHASAIMNYAKAALEGHPKLRGLVKRQLVETVELEGRVEIEVVTASIKAVRSRTVIAALLDEIAFWQPDETCANPDVEIINALRPAMITIPNSMQIGASSRYARKGVLWNAYRDHYGKPGGPLVWSADTETMHPSIDKQFLADEYERDPIAAAAEYGLEWRSDVAAFISREAVEAVVARGVFERPPVLGTIYRAFVDPSGGSSDSFTLSIAHWDRTANRSVLDVVREVRPPFGPESVVVEFATLLKMYRISQVLGDHYAGEWPREQFRKVGINYEPSAAPKSQIYQEWLPMLNSGQVELLDLPRLITQACGLERRTSRAGRDSIDHAPGAHDDVVNAAAGALVDVANGAKTPIVVSNETMMRVRAMGSMRQRLG